MTQSEFVGGWIILQRNGWPNARFLNTKETKELYYGALHDLSADQWRRAVAKTIELHSGYFPDVATLRRNGLNGELPPLPETAAARARRENAEAEARRAAESRG